jgi:hypothetical protein
MRAIPWGCLGEFALFHRTGISGGRTGRRSGFAPSENRTDRLRGAEVGKISWRIIKAYGRWALEGLLDALFLCVPANKGIEDRKDVAAVLDHAVEDIAEFGIALGVTVPLDHDGLRHFDIAAKLLG